jgi:hypothetical protein
MDTYYKYIHHRYVIMCVYSWNIESKIQSFCSTDLHSDARGRSRGEKRQDLSTVFAFHVIMMIMIAHLALALMRTQFQSLLFPSNQQRQ